jgi:hypothetical protein
MRFEAGGGVSSIRHQSARAWLGNVSRSKRVPLRRGATGCRITAAGIPFEKHAASLESNATPRNGATSATLGRVLSVSALYFCGAFVPNSDFAVYIVAERRGS